MKPRSILAVDDNADVLTLLEMVLTRDGHCVHKATSGNDALTAIRQQSFDVILLDIMMPTMNGLEILQRLRADVATQHLPVIMLTAKSRDDDFLEGYQCGADYYISKPFTPEQLRYGLHLVLGDD